MRGVKKRDLPVKRCPVCERPFVWRKKWAHTWETVRYCSERCRTAGKRRKPLADTASDGAK